MDHEPTDNVRELQTVAMQLDRLLEAAERDLEEIGPKLDIDFQGIADSFSAKTEEAREDDPRHPYDFKKLLAAEDEVNESLAEQLPIGTPMAIVAYEQAKPGGSIKRVDYQGWYCDLKTRNALVNWDSAVNKEQSDKLFVQNAQGKQCLVARLTLRVVDDAADGGFSFVYIPIDRIVSVHRAEL